MIIPVLHHCSNMFIGIPWKQVVVDENKMLTRLCISIIQHCGVQPGKHDLIETGILITSIFNALFPIKSSLFLFKLLRTEASYVVVLF